ncbi:MAG: hypothetical protein PGN11_10245 [Quadrisphaera sp.]
MTTLTTTLVTTLHGTVHGPAPEHREAAATLPATPLRVDVAELADSVVLLAPGGSLVVGARGAARWCATAGDTSVATVHTTGHGHVPADGEEVVCTLQATAPGRTRGHLVDPSGQRRPFEVIVIAPDVAPAAHRALQPSRPSWAVRLRRTLLPTGRPLSVVTTIG